MPLTPELMEKLRNQLKLIEAQAAVMADELKNPHYNCWDQDRQRKLGTIYQALRDIGAMTTR